MTADVQRELAEALAEKFTSPHGARNPDWDWEQSDGPDNLYHLPVDMAERVEQSPYVVFTAGDGCRSIRMPSCTEITDALLSTVQALIADAEKRAAAAALRGAAAQDSVSTHRLTPVEVLTLRVVKVYDLRTRADALDPT